MKQIYMVNNVISREWTGIAPTMPRVWSRIGTIKPLLALFAFLIIGAWSSEAWGYTTKITSNGLGSTGPTSKTENGITFSLNGNFNSNRTSDYYFISSSNTAEVSWTVPTGYSVAVTGVSIYAKNGQYVYWQGIMPKTGTGTGYFYTSNNSSKTKVCQSTSYGTYSYSNSNASSYFPSTGLANDGKIYFNAENAEFHIQWLEFTYTKTANTYTIAFNGNGHTSGSTSSVQATYDQNVQLTSNGFEKTKYTVTYDANGGDCLTTEAKINYGFAGWAESSTGDVKYSDGKTVKNLSSAQGATVTLFAKWNNPSSYVVTLPEAKKVGGYVLEGWYDGDTKVGEAGENYTVTKDVTLVAHLTKKFNPEISGANQNMMVDSIQNDAFSFNHAPNPVAHITIKSINPINNGNGKVIEYDAANNKIIAHNAGVAEIYFTQEVTSTINEGKSATYTYTVSKHKTSFTGSDYNLMVDGDKNADYTYTNVSAAQLTANSSDNFYYTIDDASLSTSVNKGSNVVTFNPANKQITACNAGTAKITLHQKETYKYTGDTVSFNVAVYKYNSVFSGVADMSVNVEESKNSGYILTYTKPDPNYIGADNHSAGAPSLNSGNWYYTLTQTVTSSNTTGSTDLTKSIEYIANSKTVTGKNEGTATIQLHQTETYKYNAANESFDITISKNVPVFTWKTGPYYHNTEINDVFSSTNKDCAFTIGESSDALVAKVTGNKLNVLSKGGTAEFTVAQKENYKWKFHQETYSVTPENPSNHVTFTYTQAMYNDGNITTQKESSAWDSSNQVRLGGSSTSITGAPAYNWDDKYIVIRFYGIPDKLSFQYKTNSGAATRADWSVQESTNGSSWTDVWGEDNKASTNWTSVNNQQLKTTTRYLRFCYSGNFAGYFKDIKVTELKKFAASEATLDFGSLDINTTGAATSKTFEFNYANVGHNVTLSVDDAHFSVDPATITNIGGEQTGKVTITVNYSTAEEHKATNAKLTITDELNNSATVTLKGETQKLTPTVTWSSDASYFNVEDVLSATNANGLTVTLSVDPADDSYVACSGNTATMIDAKSGTVIITAHVTGNDIYADADITKEITITNKTKQYITWEQDFSRLKINDATKSITLNATSSSGLPVTYELQGDKTGVSLTQNGNTWTLTYSATECKNTTIVAKQAGNDEYAPAPNFSLPVKVIDPNKECDGIVTPINSDTELKFTSQSQSLDIPSTITIDVKRTNTNWYAVYTAQDFKVEFFDGAGNQVGSTHTYKESEINPSKSIYIDKLDRNIKSVKLTSNAVLGYTVSRLTYTQHKYCEPSADALMFNTYPNTTTSAQTFNVKYANYPISLECTNDKFTITPTFFGDCGEHGTQTISVTYTAGPSEGNDSGILYIKDNTGKTLGTVTLSVSITQVDQNIKSHNIQQAYKTTDKVSLTAETNSGLSAFSFAASPSDRVTVNGAEMTFSKSGTISVTVSEPGSNVYRPTSTTVNNIVVSKDVPNIATAPTGTSVKYMQTLRNSTLSGGAADITLRGDANTPVEGNFAWTNPDYQVVEKAVVNNYSVTFTPTNGDMYTDKVFTIPVEILRVPQSIAMNDGSVQVRVLGLNESTNESKIDLTSLIEKKTTDPFEASRAGAITYEVISANKANSSISGNDFSASVCGEYTIRATQLQTDYYEAATDEFVITVNRLTPTISGANKTLLVDATQNNAFTIVGGKDLIPHITVNSISDINNGDGQVIEYDAVNNRIIAHNAGEAEIYLEQPQTNTIAAYNSPVYTYKVNKRSNYISNSWYNWLRTANFDEEVEVSFTTNNTDYTNSPLKVEASAADSLIALMTADGESPTSFTMKALYNVGTSTWHVSQPESYKYNKAEHDIQLTVRALDKKCYIVNDITEHSFSTDVNDLSGHFEDVDKFTVDGPVEEIYFDAKKGTLIGLNIWVNKFVAQYSADGGSTWRTICEPDLGTDYTTYHYIFSQLPDSVKLQDDENVTHVRFGAHVGATGSKYFTNIKLPRKTWLRPIANNVELTPSSVVIMPDNTVGNFTTTKFYVDYSTCEDVIKLTSNNEHFTLSREEITGGDNQGDATEVTITYRNNKEIADTATITLYTKSQHTTFTVVGNTYKKQQKIEWQEGFTERPLFLPAGTVADNTNIAAKTTRPNGTVVYTTDNTEVIEIILSGLGFKIVGNGEAKLCASSEGNDEWYPVSDTITITTSNKLMQEIVWEQSFRNAGLELEQDTVLQAKVYIRQPNGDLVFNQECTDRIVYTCPANNGVISVNENIMTILGYGKTTVTASVAETENYIEASSVTLTVKIAQQEDVCTTPNVLEYEENIKFVTTSLDLSHGQVPELTSEIILLNSANGKPNMLSYWHNGENYIIRQCRGTVKIQQRISGIWEDVENSSYYNPEAFDWREDSIQLSEDAEAIQFVRLGGAVGIHNIKDITITLKQYLRPTEEILNLGEIQIGEEQHKSIGIDYSDVKAELQVSKHRVDDATLTFDDQDIDTISCGAHGHFELPISILPSKLGEWSDSIIVVDTITEDTAIVVIRATIVSGTQYVFETEGPWAYEPYWQDWNIPNEENSALITANVDIEAGVDVAVKSLTIQEGVTVTVHGTLTLGDGNSLTLAKYGNLHVADGGKVNVGTGALLVNDFILDASLGNKEKSGSSGQVENLETLYVCGDAYFQLTFDPRGKITYGWYDFTVPFEVEVLNGVYDKDGNKLTNKVDYAVMEFSEERRAKNTGRPWIWFNGTMQPSQLYTITLDDAKTWNTFRFKKKKGSSVQGSNSYAASYSNIGATTDRGWNGLGNGTLQYRQLNNLPAQTKIQVEDHTNECYVEKEASDYTYAVGTAFFVQVPAEQNVDLTAVDKTEETPRGFLAPSRDGKTTDEFRLALTAEGAEYASDNLWVSASEEATGEYMIGRDLLKMGTPTDAKVAQMWAVSNNNLLCDIELPLANDAARCDLHLFAPQAKKYSLAVEKAPQDVVLYLTYNDRPIWNLTMSPYEFDLEQGTTEGYGLQLYVRQSPEVATGVDSVQDEEVGARKVLINDIIYIITPEGKIYDAVGKGVNF